MLLFKVVICLAVMLESHHAARNASSVRLFVAKKGHGQAAY